MARSIQLVDWKVVESEFFLGQIPTAEFNFFAAQAYTNSFVYNCRGITFAIQSVLSDIKGFKDWYGEKQKELRKNDLCSFFNEYRRLSTHVGEQFVQGGTTFRSEIADKRIIKYYFRPSADLKNVPEEDVVESCRKYFIIILGLVYECYENFKFSIDSRWYFTRSNFERNNKTIEDAEEELGFPRGWTHIEDLEGEEIRWKMLRRDQAGCSINHLFHKYLDKVFEQPE